MLILAVTIAASAAETRYVQASSLNLRAGPSATAKVLGKLSIGSPLVILEAGAAPFVHVRVANGKEGWVDGTFLAASALTAADALARAKSAATPSDRLSWAQRAAALASDATTLAELEAAYRAAGQAGPADQVAAERRWPHTIFPAVPRDGMELEWAMVSPPEPVPRSGEVEVPLSEVRARTGLDPAAPWSVLPASGPAVQVRLASAAVSSLNECAGSWGLVLRFEGPLPEGAAPLAFSSGAPPASWTKDPPAPPVSREVAIAAGEAAEKARGWSPSPNGPSVTAVALPDGWRVRVVHDGEAAGDGDQMSYGVVDLQVDAAGARVLREETVEGYEAPDSATAARDVNGDGTVDLVWRGRCATWISSSAGGALASTEDRCCGC